MSFGQRQINHGTQYNGSCINRQIPSLIPNSYQGNKMQSNRKEVNDVRSMPPLIPVKHTPPSLCPIPQQTGGKDPHNNTAHYNNLQSQPIANMQLPDVQDRTNRVPVQAGRHELKTVSQARLEKIAQAISVWKKSSLF